MEYLKAKAELNITSHHNYKSIELYNSFLYELFNITKSQVKVNFIYLKKSVRIH